MRVGKIKFPEVIRLAVNTRGAFMRASIRGLPRVSWDDPLQRT
jgi:hypothetical protein